MALHQQASSSTTTLFPQLESTIPPLDDSELNNKIVAREIELVASIKTMASAGNPLDDIADVSILPAELIEAKTRTPRAKVDPLNRLKEIQTEEKEEEEEEEDEEEEDEEQVVEDEEDDAGGDYIISHFDNGEGFEDNDEDGDDMTSMI